MFNTTDTAHLFTSACDQVRHALMVAENHDQYFLWHSHCELPIYDRDAWLRLVQIHGLPGRWINNREHTSDQLALLASSTFIENMVIGHGADRSSFYSVYRFTFKRSIIFQ